MTVDLNLLAASEIQEYLLSHGPIGLMAAAMFHLAPTLPLLLLVGFVQHQGRVLFNLRVYIQWGTGDAKVRGLEGGGITGAS